MAAAPRRCSAPPLRAAMAATAATAATTAATTAAVEGKMSKSLKKILKKCIAEDAHEQLAVADAKLGNAIKEKLDIACVNDSKINELMRCIRSQISGLISGKNDINLAHSVTFYCIRISGFLAVFIHAI